ncbi:MAG: hypothetical protein U0228_23830 [Myxococcaceae bacterium]
MGVGKVSSSQVRATQQKTVEAPKPKTTQAAQDTKKAGWGQGAPKATSLKITMATIDEGPKTTQNIQVPKGYTASLKNDSMKLSDKVGDKAASYEQDVAHLTVKNPAGKSVELWAEGASDFSGDWKEEVAAQKKDPSEFAMLDWSYGRSLSGVGTAGKMMSVQENANDYMGGAHPNHATTVRTYDASTGKQVKLEDLLSQQQMNSLVNDLSKKLGSMKGPDDIGPESFNFGGDKAAIRNMINENFALVADKSGKVKIDISWDSGVHALGGLLGHVQVEAPTDSAFRAKIGLE